MEKLYSKKALLVKGFCCFFLPLAQQLFVSDYLIWIFISFVAVGCLYTIPFRLTLSKLYKAGEKEIGKYILLDLASCYAPAVTAALLYEAYVEVFVQSAFQNGLYTLLLAIILLLISGIFWILYKFAGRHSRP